MTTDEKSERAESVSRMLKGEDAPTDTDRESQVGPTGGGDAEMAPPGVGESTAHRGENIIKEEGKEAGQTDTGTDDSATERPTGTSSPRDMGGVDAQEGNTGRRT